MPKLISVRLGLAGSLPVWRDAAPKLSFATVHCWRPAFVILLVALSFLKDGPQLLALCLLSGHCLPCSATELCPTGTFETRQHRSVIGFSVYSTSQYLATILGFQLEVFRFRRCVLGCCELCFCSRLLQEPFVETCHLEVPGCTIDDFAGGAGLMPMQSCEHPVQILENHRLLACLV